MTSVVNNKKSKFPIAEVEFDMKPASGAGQLDEQDKDNQYEQVLEGSVYSIVTIDTRGNIQYFNPAAEKLWGYSRQEVLGQNVKILTPPDVRVQPDGYLNNSQQTGQDQVTGGSREVKALRKDGTLVDILLSLSESEVNGVRKFTAFVIDITEKKHLEADARQQAEQMKSQEEVMRQHMEEMQATQEQLQHILTESQNKERYLGNLIDASKDVILTFDHTYRIIHYNQAAKAFYATTGITIEENVNLVDAFPADGRDAFKQLLNRALAGEAIEMPHDTADRHQLVNYIPIRNEKEEVIAVAQFAKDVTQLTKAQKETERLLRESQAQEEELRQNMEELSATQEEMERRQLEMDSQFAAIDSTSAYVEFDLDGIVLTANRLFLSAIQYSLEEIQGKHHRLFVDPKDGNSPAYATFWNNLKAGRPQTGEFRRIAKDGSEIWLMSNYTPVLDRAGNVLKIIKLATDITAQKLRNADFEGQLAAVSRSQAVIEFNLDGTIIKANDNFLHVLGYRLEEVQGKHHQLFCDPQYVNSPAYKAFWEKLNRGEFDASTFKQIGKGGKEVWIQATYNPILDLNGKPFKVVQYATDVTEFTMALKAVSQFIGELRGGNFNASINAQAEGDVGQMIQDNLALRDMLKGIISEVNAVVKAAGQEGNLNARLNLKDVKGEWKALVDSLNMLLQSVSEPVLEFNSIITEMSKGDLTQRFTMAVNGDILSMAKALNMAIDNLNSLLNTINTNSGVVAEASDLMLQKSEGMKKNTTEVASAIIQMAKGAQDQANRTDESSKLVEEMMRSVNMMEDKANGINKAAERGQKSSEDGLKIVRKLVENMGEISQSATKTSGSIAVLTQRAEDIARTLKVITDIAAQTNLLALNAAIEAARAGDAGRGFAVVAEEIRKLAEDSRRSAVDIEKIISDVQKDTLAAGKAIETMESSVKLGNGASRDAEDVFSEIARSTDETFNFSKQIQEATSGQKTSITKVVKNMEQIVIVAEETAAGTQQVAASSQSLNLGMNDITESSNVLSQVAEELQAGVNQFKLKK